MQLHVTEHLFKSWFWIFKYTQRQYLQILEFLLIGVFCGDLNLYFFLNENHFLL